MGPGRALVVVFDTPCLLCFKYPPGDPKPPPRTQSLGAPRRGGSFAYPARQRPTPLEPELKAKHGTLTGSSTVDTITVTGADPGVSVLMISLPNGSGDAYFTVAANGATAATPTVAGDDTYHLGPAHPALSVGIGQTTSFQVKLISTAALAYSIHAE